jgi:hypothetical protein
VRLLPALGGPPVASSPPRADRSSLTATSPATQRTRRRTSSDRLGGGTRSFWYSLCAALFYASAPLTHFGQPVRGSTSVTSWRRNLPRGMPEHPLNAGGVIQGTYPQG